MSEDGGERIQALRLLRRGLAASPELRRGAWLTLALALVAGGGRVITPVLVQQTIDRHVTGGPVRLSAMLGLAGAGGSPGPGLTLRPRLSYRLVTRGANVERHRPSGP